MNMTRRAFLGMAGMALLSAGCGNRKEKLTKTASIGDEITLSTEHGDLAVTVEGFVDNENITRQLDDSGWVQEGKTIGNLLLVVKNKGLDDEYDELIDLANLIYPVDSDGVALSPLNAGLGYDDYTSAPGAVIVELPQGMKKRFNVPYVISQDDESFKVFVGDYEVETTITRD